MLTFDREETMRHSKSLFAIIGIRPLSWAMALLVAVLTVITPPLSQKTYAATGWQKLTEAELTVIWWQWLYSIPASQSPAIDDTGANAYSAQPYSDLLFLAGTLSSIMINGDVVGTATRSISVKDGTALFFPLLNVETDNVCARPNLGGNCFDMLKFPNNLGAPQLQALATALMDPASGLFATLTPTDQNFNQNGTPIPVVYTRLQSPHPFPYKLPAKDNLYQPGINVSGTVAPAAGDGYYALIPLGTLTLDQGYYTLKFGGKVPLNSVPNYFILDITYDITVTP
jgi:hypothetical protein